MGILDEGPALAGSMVSIAASSGESISNSCSGISCDPASKTDTSCRM